MRLQDEVPRLHRPSGGSARDDGKSVVGALDRAKKPSEAAFRRALGYNMRVPAAVRRAVAGWSTSAPLTIDALRRVTVPVLITHGRQDTVVLPAAAEMTASTIAHARLSWFDDCGHSPFVEDAARFNDELAAFVESATTR